MVNDLFIDNNRVFIYLVDMPVKARAVTVISNVDEFTVYINENLSREAQIEARDHEMYHIKKKDYDHFYDVNMLEHFRGKTLHTAEF